MDLKVADLLVPKQQVKNPLAIVRASLTRLSATKNRFRFTTQGMTRFRFGTYFFACRNALIEEREGAANLRQTPGKSAIEMDERFPETETYFEGIYGH